MLKKTLVMLVVVATMLTNIGLITALADMKSEAKQIDLNKPVTDNLPKSDSVRYYKVELDKPGNVVLRFTHGNVEKIGESWSITMYDSTEAIVQSFDSKGTETVSESINTYLSAGTYYVRVNTRYNIYHSDSDYTLTVNFTENTGGFEIEPNNTRDKATLISEVNKPIVGNLRTRDDVDWYSITLQKPGRIVLHFTHGNVEKIGESWTITMFDSTEAVVQSFDSKGTETVSESINTYLSAGTYYIRINARYNMYHSDKDYSLTVNFTENTGGFEIEPNDVMEKATPIREINKPITGNLSLSSDVDWFKFTIENPGNIVMGFAHGNAEKFGESWMIKLFDGTGKELLTYASKGDVTTGESDSVSLGKGEYYVKVAVGYTMYYSNLDYNLTIKSSVATFTKPADVDSPPAGGNVSEWAKEEIAKAEDMGLIPEVLQNADLTKPITRAEFAAVSVKTYESLSGDKATSATTNPFADCNDAEVLKAYNLGITAGMSATTFEPNRLLSREEAATMLTRVFKKVTMIGWTLQSDNDFSFVYTKPAPFADDAQISNWAKDSVYFMVANEIIKGMGNNKFAPKNTTSVEDAQRYANATREQALIIAVRMVENLK